MVKGGFEYFRSYLNSGRPDAQELDENGSAFRRLIIGRGKEVAGIEGEESLSVFDDTIVTLEYEFGELRPIENSRRREVELPAALASLKMYRPDLYIVVKRKMVLGERDPYSD